MQQNKLQSGRSMLEMLSVLAVVGILSIAGLAGFKYAMDQHKANQMLDYMNRVFLTVKAKGDDDRSASPNPQSTDPNNYFSCEEVVGEAPEYIYGCGANRVCQSGKSCITNVFAYFAPGEIGAAAALESKLGLKPRGKRPAQNRLFQKSSCVDDTPIVCSHGFSPCATITGTCDGTPREFSNGKPKTDPDYYSDEGCETSAGGCRVW